MYVCMDICLSVWRIYREKNTLLVSQLYIYPYNTSALPPSPFPFPLSLLQTVSCLANMESTVIAGTYCTFSPLYLVAVLSARTHARPV